MKRTHAASTIPKLRKLILLGTVAAVATTVACSSNSRPAGRSVQPVTASVRPAVLETVAPAGSQPASSAVPDTMTSPVKSSPSKLSTFRSRDYGVSFLYPWQYAYFSAKAIANGDSSLLPKSDGHDGQFTLARIEIPRGFYPDTDFESGYFTLSLNQDLSEQECESVLDPGKDNKVQTDTINGVDFRWIETDGGGGGSASKLRNYVAFSHGTCYELEMGVKTRNEQGLAREVDPDQVLRRLDAIVKTVKITPMQNPVAPQAERSAEMARPDSQN